MNCALCNIFLTETNDSKEHIIPQSIGGKKAIKGYICEDCNNRKGCEWDSVLAKELHSLANFFQIKRERGSTPPLKLQSLNGESFLRLPTGQLQLTKPVYQKKIMDEKCTEITIQARNEKEALQQIARAKKEYPKIDDTKLKEQIKMSSTYINNVFQMNLGVLTDKCYKSIVKTALAIVTETGISIDLCQRAKDYLQSKSDKNCFGYYYEIDPILNRPKDIPLHCIFVKGDPNNGIVFAYIELFGLHRGLVCLADTYSGDSFQSYYSINPKNSQNLELNIDITLSKDELNKFIKINEIDFDKFNNILHDLVPPQLELNSKNAKQRVIDNAINEGFQNCGAKEGEYLTAEHMKNLTDSIIKSLKPWILSHMKDKP